MGRTYRRPKKLPLIKRSRTIPLHGTGDDEGRYFKCWNCGFVCDSKRDQLGDSESNAGDDHTDYHSLAKEQPSFNYGGKLVDAGNRSMLSGVGHCYMATELGCHRTAERVINGDFSRWVDGVPVGWVQYGTPDSTNYVENDSNRLRVVRNESVSGVWQNVLSTSDIDKEFRVSIDIVKSVSGTITLEQGASNYITSTDGISTVGTHTYTHIPKNTNGYVIGATNSTDISVKNFSVQRSTRESSNYVRIPRTVRHDLTSDVSRGCPFCGTLNWRGDY